MNIFDTFDRIYVINLPQRSDRLLETLRELHRNGLAVNDPRLHIFAAIRPQDAGPFASIGARGCYLSHLAVIREAMEAKLKNVLILEDDVSLHQFSQIPQGHLLQTIMQGDWDFAYLGHHQDLANGTNPALAQAARWQLFDGPVACAHCYALNQRVLPALVDYLSACLEREIGDPFGGPIHVDGALAMFRQRQSSCCTLLASPSLAGQRSSRSDIYPTRWFDRWPVVRNAVALYRKTRNWQRERNWLHLTP